MCEIWGTHGDEVFYACLLIYNATWTLAVKMEAETFACTLKSTRPYSPEEQHRQWKNVSINVYLSREYNVAESWELT
jgi:hypothetical protein